jgi:hypothetical protein
MINKLSSYGDYDYDDLLTWDQEQIIYYYYWYELVESRRDLCRLIAEYIQYDDVKGAVDD